MIADVSLHSWFFSALLAALVEACSQSRLAVLQRRSQLG